MEPLAETDTKSRHVPAAVRREVWKRDQGQCTYVDERGKRCKARQPGKECAPQTICNRKARMERMAR